MKLFAGSVSVIVLVPALKLAAPPLVLRSIAPVWVIPPLVSSVSIPGAKVAGGVQVPTPFIIAPALEFPM